MTENHISRQHFLKIAACAVLGAAFPRLALAQPAGPTSHVDKTVGECQIKRKKNWFASALAGTVLVVGFCGRPTLQAAEQKAPRGSGKVIGIVTSKTDKDITVKADGEEAKRYLLAPPGGAPSAELQAALKTVFVPNLVRLSWQGEEQPVLTSIRVIIPPVRASVATGIVVARASKPKEVAWLEVKPIDHGPAQRFWPPFGPGGMDKEVSRTFGELNVGDKVRVNWYYDERLRATKIKVLSRAKKTEPEEKKETPPESPGEKT